MVSKSGKASNFKTQEQSFNNMFNNFKDELDKTAFINDAQSMNGKDFFDKYKSLGMSFGSSKRAQSFSKYYTNNYSTYTNAKSVVHDGVKIESRSGILDRFNLNNGVKDTAQILRGLTAGISYPSNVGIDVTVSFTNGKSISRRSKVIPYYKFDELHSRVVESAEDMISWLDVQYPDWFISNVQISTYHK